MVRKCKEKDQKDKGEEGRLDIERQPGDEEGRIY